MVSGKASLTEDARQTEKKAEESERTEQKAKKPEQTEQESEEPERTEQESGGNSGRQNIERKAYSTEDFAMQDSDGRLRKKFDINNENEMNQLLVFYAQMNVAYYNKKDRTDEEVKVRRRINAQFKRIIDKKATALINGENNEESNFEQKIQEINNGTMFTSGDIEEIAKSKGATIKLFQIMSSGVYEKDGIRTRLSQKQRCALANVLQKVSEKKLDTENAKLGEKGKKDKTSDGVVKVSEIGG